MDRSPFGSGRWWDFVAELGSEIAAMAGSCKMLVALVPQNLEYEELEAHICALVVEVVQKFEE